ncbi:MAG: very short patch repair endonuclease [Bacteroidales bacterium]|nr:very short patch repair endonuclease [Bacteroidales bacterium]
MPDRLTPEQRHKNMSSIHSRNTKPEILVRQYLWSHGYRYRLNSKKLPGKPDIVLAKYKTCIFINGCFWHGHDGCRYYTVPKSNTEFWVNKVARNRQRDGQVRQKLEIMGWHCITIWECELKKEKRKQTLESLLDMLSRFYFKGMGISIYEIQEDDICFMVAEDSNTQYDS